MTRLLQADTAGIAEAVDLLARGRIVALPTETVYGLAADAANGDAVAAVFQAKGRPGHNPLIIHTADLAGATALGLFDDVSLALARAFWPGPLSLVVPRTQSCIVAPAATPGGQTIALRCPAHPVFRAVLEKLQRPLAAPSANPSGMVSPTRASHVMDGLQGRIAAVVDGGPALVGVESTVVRVTDGRAQILRPGGISRADIEAVCGPLAIAPLDPDKPSSPGLLAVHYAPRAIVRLNADCVNPGEALLAFGGNIPAHDGPCENLSPSGNLVEAAANLFDLLRRLDQTRAAVIAVMPIPMQGLGEAINDRLHRAAAPRGE